MKTQRLSPLRIVAAAIVAACMMCACSTTRRIPDDDILYTGLKKVDIAPTDSGKLAPEIRSQIKNAVNVAPNNYFKLIGWRYPFPLGLWV